MFQLSNYKPLLNSDLMKSLFIQRVEDHSEPGITRARVFFENGLILSVIRGQYTLGNEQGLFEVALFPDCIDVLGYLSKEDVMEIIREVGVGNITRFKEESGCGGLYLTS